MQHLFSKNLKQFYFYYFILSFYKLMAFAAISPKSIGKNQIAFGDYSQLKIDVMDDNKPLEFKNFNIEPNETILENDGRSLVIQMTYEKDKLPFLKVPYYDKKFVFEYMYFQWLEKVPKRFSFENISFHGQLHVVFYDSRYKDFAEALYYDYVVIMAFGVEVNPLGLNKYKVLQENLKTVQQPYMQTVIKNMPLAYWLNVSMESFCLNTGTISLLSTPNRALWVDIAEPIEMTPQVVFEFQHLQTVDGKPLIKQFQPVNMEEVEKLDICNYKPSEEFDIKNSSNRFKAIILTLIIFAQVGVLMIFGLS